MSERNRIDPAFLVDEEPIPTTRTFQEQVAQAIRREHELRSELTSQHVTLEQERQRTAKFLRDLISAKERRCDDLILSQRGRLSDPEQTVSPEDELTARWLARVESIQATLQRELEKFEVVPFEPSGLAQPERDEIRDVVAAGAENAGMIVQVVRPGYEWRGEILRPSQVIVGE